MTWEMCVAAVAQAMPLQIPWPSGPVSPYTALEGEQGLSSPTDKNTALRLLRGLENGGMNAEDARSLAETLDPVLVYVIVQYLREVYPASNPAATAVLDRVVALTLAWSDLVAKSKQGELDVVSRWFASQYSFAEFRDRGTHLVELIVDKLES